MANLPKCTECVFVRYMGPKFVIAFSGVDLEGVEEFVKTVKSEIEAITIKKEKKNITKVMRICR